MNAGICLALAFLYLAVWFRKRDAWANLFFSVSAAGGAAMAFLELGLMHAQTAMESGESMRWLQVALAITVVGLVWFVRFYLKAGNLWLAWLFCGMRALILVINFLPGQANAVFLEMKDPLRIPMWGSLVSLSQGVKSSWELLGGVSSFVFLVFLFGASRQAWRRGEHKGVIILCGAISFGFIFGSVQARMLAAGQLFMPYSLSMAFMIIVLGMGFEMSRELIAAAFLSHELRKEKERIALAAKVTNLGLWEWDVLQNEIWATEAGQSRVGSKTASFSFDLFLQSIHPDDIETTQQEIFKVLEEGKYIQLDYRSINPQGETRWIETHGRVERDAKGKPVLVRGVSLDITERKRTEAALYKSEHFAQTLLNTTDAMTHILDEEGTIIDLNDSMSKGLGGTREELIGTNVFDRFTRKSAKRRLEVFKRVALEQKLLRFEDVDTERDKVFDTIIFPLTEIQGEKRQFAVFAHDITAIRKMEVAYRESMERYKAIVDSFDGFIYICSQDNRIEFMNQRLIDRTGRNAVGDPCYEVLHESDSVCEWCVNDNIFQGGTVHWEIQSPKDHRWYYIINTPIRHVDGTISKQSLIMDITDRKQAEVALKESEKRLREAQRIACIGNWELDLITNTSTCSDEILKIFEIDREDFGTSYETFLAAVHPDDRDTVNAAYKGSLEYRKPYNITHRLLMTDGRIKYVQERCETSYGPEGKPVRSVGTVQDITERIHVQKERRELRHELAHLNRIMSMNELATSLAHEINQPLGAIMNNVAAAKTICTRCEGGNGEVLEILEDVISDANRAGQIVRKVRGVVKKEDSRREFEMLNMNVRVDEAINLLQSTLNINQINVHLDKQPDLLPVRGDRVRLEQVIVNLVTNAIEAMKESPEKTLTIRTAMQSPEMVIISISNSGSGIGAEIRERLFEPFFSTKKSGLGMGLRICKSIVEEHGGMIWLEDPKDDNTTFSFTLKVHQGDAA